VPKIPAAEPAVVSQPGLARLARLLACIADKVVVPRFEIRADHARNELSMHERALSNYLKLSPADAETLPLDAGFADQVIARTTAAEFEQTCSTWQVISADGVPLRVYGAGVRHGSTVLIASACGMPASLCRRWLRFLGREHFAVTWETRGLFGGPGGLGGCDPLSCGVDAQVDDLLAIMNRLEIETAHVMGFCGGAVLALCAAARFPTRIDSISLWHGDLRVGPDCPRTSHQKHLSSILRTAASGPGAAKAMRDILLQNVQLSDIRADLAPLLLYPFATSELLFRYSNLNATIMEHDVGDALAAVRQPALVVTSEDDATAHPASSHRAAAELWSARLHVLAHGDHISLFDARFPVTRVAADFLRQMGRRRGS
jgi:pimeloyl-ACP methyl ester carboxylesterase